jgi:hypothetical protein
MVTGSAQPATNNDSDGKVRSNLPVCDLSQDRKTLVTGRTGPDTKMNVLAEHRIQVCLMTNWSVRQLVDKKI